MGIFEKERSIMVEEIDVTNVLMAVNQNIRVVNLIGVYNCGWEDESNIWCIEFMSTEKKYNRIVRDLSEKGEFRLKVRPGGQVDTYFTRGYEVQ